MFGPEVNPKTLSTADKVDFLITQVASLTNLDTRLSGQMETITERMNKHDSHLACLEKKPQEGEPSGPNIDGIDSEPEDSINVNAGRGYGHCTGYDGGDGRREGYDDFYRRLNDDFYDRTNDDFYGRRNDDFYGRPRGGCGGQERYDGGFHHPNRYE
jgi:hypothetical protein